MFYRLFVAKDFLIHYRIALHFLKLPDAASPGVRALAQELNSITIHRKANKRVIIGWEFFIKVTILAIRAFRKNA